VTVGRSAESYEVAVNPGVLVCPVNVSEGRSSSVLARLRDAAAPDLLDVHTDPHHHRSVLTVAGEDAARRVAEAAVGAIDLGSHSGVHPRSGAVDVVPFVPWEEATMAEAVDARDRFVVWIAGRLGVPAFAYGEDGPTLPEVRRRAFVDLAPDAGPSTPHPTAGSVAVGARRPLVAYNVWLKGDDVDRARAIAVAIRSPDLRALGLLVGDRAQVSMNLVAPDVIGPAEAYDRVVATDAPVDAAELVGLLPGRVLERIAEARWEELDVGADRTVEARLARWRAARD
jgi:glutamate formiminotransferase / 5-formyltetrahydrofolate cyclo-ligase